MDSASAAEVRVDVQNIGGIEDTSVTLTEGVTVLVGRNATNRTSFLQALMAACGSTNASLKSDAEAGEYNSRWPTRRTHGR